MAKKIVNLRGKPEDEVEEIRELFTNNDIEFYETPAGNWGVSMPSIWLNNDEDYPKAESLLAEYQLERYERIHSEYEQLKKEGQHDTVLKRLAREPVQVLFYTVAIIAIIYLTLSPFIYN